MIIHCALLFFFEKTPLGFSKQQGVKFDANIPRLFQKSEKFIKSSGHRSSSRGNGQMIYVPELRTYQFDIANLLRGIPVSNWLIPKRDRYIYIYIYCIYIYILYIYIYLSIYSFIFIWNVPK